MGVAQILGETKVSVGDRSWPAAHVDLGNPHAVVMRRRPRRGRVAARGAGVRREAVPGRRQRRVRRTPRGRPRRDARPRARVRRDPLVRHRRVCGGDRCRPEGPGALAGRRTRRQPRGLARRGGPRLPDRASGHRRPRPRPTSEVVWPRPADKGADRHPTSSLGSARMEISGSSRSSPGPRRASVPRWPDGSPRPGRPS